MRVIYSICISIYYYILFLLFLSFPAAAQNPTATNEKNESPEHLEFPAEIDFATLGAALWRGIKPSSRFHFYMVEDFEEGKLWNVQAVHGDATARLVRQEPLAYMPASKENLTWQDHFYTDLYYTAQSAILDKRSPPAVPKYSFEILWRVQNAGEENLRLLPPKNSSPRTEKKVFLPIHARPLEIALWVKGNGRTQNLHALFYRSSGGLQRILIATVDFKGWRRISAKLPLHVCQFRKGKDRTPWFQFGGFEVSTQKSQAGGFYSLLIDQVVILADHYYFNYSGEEIKDDWR